ncbi:MAG: response regulator [Calditrichaeota bacterium]|jgi:AmiR/NasT family two-component response regulator|nr:response regulator [Calditrichota bacterium]MBT7617291.1 response regulator [Calditrichota bacterium]MBT7789239.1 response regulator [Calditrichota bacterium]
MEGKTDIRILIAEDDYLVSEDISRTVKSLGYQQVGIASNGQKAVEMCSSLNPDVVLMDIKMPKMDGLEATKHIQKKCPTPVVILTAHETSGLLGKASEAGAGAYLTKPPNAAEITRAITIAMARHDDLMESRNLVGVLKEKKEQLEKAISEVKTLKGLLPICAHCKKIRDDKGTWQHVEVYIRDRSQADFTHSICPICTEELYPEFYNSKT